MKSVEEQLSDTFLILEDYTYSGIPFKVVRDDLFPMAGGGSKARKASEYESFLRNNGYNAVVTCGGVQSNHNRAIALMCAKNGWKCHLCIQDNDNRFYKEKGNAEIIRLCGAEYELIDSSKTAEAMDASMELLKKEGFNPFYVIGGGHNLPGGTCFVSAVKELKRKCEIIDYKPDYIFLASGTGSTQAGIVVGLNLVGWNDVKCIGISVARQRERGVQVVVDYANMLSSYYGIDKDYSRDIVFCTDYLFGGYEKFSSQMDTYLRQVTKATGLLFDTTYSGKGFYGMMKEIERNQLANKKILFWHTGGLLNILC